MNKKQRNANRDNALAVFADKKRACWYCGEMLKGGGHYVPPGFGSVGFFSCKAKDEATRIEEAKLIAEDLGADYE